MNTIKIWMSIGFIQITSIAFSQNLNWANWKQDQRHIINLNAGLDYSVSYGLGYGYKFKKQWPALLTAEYSQPSGNKLIDDFKTKLGVQLDVYNIGPLHLVAKAFGIFRRYENDYVSILNFGSDLSATVGYFKPRWFGAADVGFDKAIATHFKHSALFREHFSNVKNGWYEPATGGNFYYGLNAGLSIKQSDIYLKVGKVISQDFKTKLMLPFYVQLGFSYKFTTPSKG
jgi:hypothetical protein